MEIEWATRIEVQKVVVSTDRDDEQLSWQWPLR